jgi:hypothetical protein
MNTKKRKDKNKNSNNSEFYFDDCPICQAMKNAEERGEDIGESELKKAFAVANKLIEKKSFNN